MAVAKPAKTPEEIEDLELKLWSAEECNELWRERWKTTRTALKKVAAMRVFVPLLGMSHGVDGQYAIRDLEIAIDTARIALLESACLCGKCQWSDTPDGERA